MYNQYNKKRKGQDEIIGFAVIIVIVAVIMLVLLAFYIAAPKTRDTVESFEVSGYLQAILQYTTDCESNLEHRNVQDLVMDCNSNEVCLNGKNSCDALEETLKGITAESWKVGNTPIQGYYMNVTLNGKNIIDPIKVGNQTGNAKGAFQDLVRGGNDIGILFEVYY